MRLSTSSTRNLDRHAHSLRLRHEGIPKVLTIRGSDWNVHSASRGFLYAHTRIASAFTKISPSAPMTVSYGFTQNGGRVDAICTANLYVGASLTQSTCPDSCLEREREAKALLGFPECKERWILFNSLSLKNPIKRFSLAKQAFDLAQERLGNLRLRLAADLPHDAMPLFVAACDLILCTSDNEGWPNSVKEALACNVPFVATDVSDLRNIALTESSCRVCPPDPGVIADNICDVLGRPAPEGLRKHVLNMSLEATSDQLISTYRSVLSRYHWQGCFCDERCVSSIFISTS